MRPVKLPGMELKPDLDGTKEGAALPVQVKEILGRTVYTTFWMPWGPKDFALMRKHGKEGKIGLSIVVVPVEGSEHPELSVKLMAIEVGP